ncbi:MAG: YqgE/AlgH family protein [Akkermansiaceae bacterium]|nr:YqgE/AlgH family protein [Akkermansiaceae bacterium]MCP5550198.1 YqgE/AlgH family protein [Akkermansiaceae bacterium]
MNFDEDDDESPDTLKGRIILADPSLREPTFRHSVLLLTEHKSEYGAHGYILNRPLGKTVGDLLEDEQFEPLLKVPVFVGGPVSTEHLTFSSLGWSEADDSLLFSTHLSTKQAVLHQMEGFSIRAFVGYSGWSEGQLESELAQNSWIPRMPERRVLETSDLDTLWNRLLRELSPWHALIADEPDNIGMN